ncbi:MAG: MarR family transcriptional regulator [Hyphomicrobiales bacterium]
MMQKLDEKILPLYFGIFNEIAIINQLSGTKLDSLMPKGLKGSHFGVLNHLTRLGDGSTPLAIATAFQVAKTTMTHTLSGLEKHGMVKILPNPADGRSKQVWLTEAGKKLRLDTIKVTAPILSQALHGFTVEQVETLVQSLSQIRTILDNNRK